MIIALEGPDGSGKTSVARELKERFQESREGKWELTRCPGSDLSKLCPFIRNIFLSEDIDYTSRYFLIWADFHEMFHNIIPFLASPGVVHNYLIERFVISTYVYQYKIAEVVSFSSLVKDIEGFYNRVRNIWPKCYIIYLDLDEKNIQHRLIERSSTESGKTIDNWNDMDRWTYHHPDKIRKYYDEALQVVPSIIPMEVIKVNATSPVYKVVNSIFEHINTEG